jgi:hypothetical protein
MTQEDIIRMAREAGLDPDLWNYTDAFERFAALVAAHERESVAASSKRDLTCVCGAVWEGDQMVHAPRPREWVGLTADEIWKCNKAKSGSAEFHICYAHQNVEDFAEAIEAKLKGKNQ